MDLSPTASKVLALFMENVGEDLDDKDIAEALGLSQKVTLLALFELETAGLVQGDRDGVQ